MKTHSYQVQVNGYNIQYATKCARVAHNNYRYFVPGKWYNYPKADGRIQTVTLLRDGEVIKSKHAQY